jgi:hypothetical protein
MGYFPDEARLDMQFKKLIDASLYLPFDDDVDDDSGNGQTPSTETGGIIHPAHVTPQVGVGAVQLAEATTNLITNPSFETNTTGWAASGSNTIAQSTEQEKVGSNSLKCTYQDNAQLAAYAITLTAAAHVFGIWIYIPANYDGTDLKVDFLNFAGMTGETEGDVDMTKTAVWQFVVAEGTPVGGDLAGDLRVYENGSTPTAGRFVYIDAAQCEAKAYATPYCDGSLGTGHTWSGTAHASTSSRTDVTLNYDTGDAGISETEGTFAAWVMFCEVANGENQRIFGWWDAWNTESIYFDITGTGYANFVIYDGSSQQIAIQHLVTDWSAYEWHHVAVVWKVNDCRLYIDGVQEGEDTVCTMPSITSENFRFGDGLAYFMDDAVVLDYALTDNEVENLYYEGYDGRDFEGVWTNVIEDVLIAGEVFWRYGFFGMMPTDRTAGTGTMDFALNNSENNSAGLLGYYSRGHANVRGGFELGIRTRIWFEESGVRYYKFIGKLTKATPITGKKRERTVECTAVDWMGEASLHKVDLMEVEQDIRSDDAFQKIVENLVTQPDAVVYGVGQETFAYWGDDLKDERTTGMGAFDRVNMSEFGYSFIRGGATPGELVYQNRHARVKDTTVQKTFAEGDLSDMSVRVEEGDVKNRIEAVVYPREVSSSDENLYRLQNPLLIPANATKTILARYTDPDNRDVRLSGLDLNDPEGLNAITDDGDERGFEDGITGWTLDTDGSGGSVAQSSVQAKHGTYSLLLTTGTSNPAYYYAVAGRYSGFAQNDVVRAQAYVYLTSAPPSGETVELVIQEYDGAVWQASHTVATTVETSGWVRLAGEVTLTDADTDSIMVVVGYTSGDYSGGAETCYIDEVYAIKSTLVNFEFSSSDVGGGDKDDDLVMIDSVLGGNRAQLVVENTSDVDGYLTVLKVRGLAVRTYDPVMQFAEGDQSIDDHFKRTQFLQLKYQDDPLVGQDWANKVLSDRENVETVLENLSVHAARSSGNLLAVLDLEPGERIDVTESVAAIDDEYFINGVEYRMRATDQGVALMAIYTVVVAGTEAYWLLGEVGAGELGETTWLGF